MINPQLYVFKMKFSLDPAQPAVSIPAKAGLYLIIYRFAALKRD